MTAIFQDDGDIVQMIGFDYETYLTTNNLQAPRAVCCSFASYDPFPKYMVDLIEDAQGSEVGAIFEKRKVGTDFEHHVALVHPHVAARILGLILTLSKIRLVYQNGVYDLGVTLQHAHLMEKMGDAQPGFQEKLHYEFLKALDVDGTGLPDSPSRFIDTMVRESLLKNASGRGIFGTGLGAMVAHYLDEDRTEDKKGTICVECKGEKRFRERIPAKRAGKTKWSKWENCATCEGKGYEKPWRTKYHELDGIPFSEWPDRALQYAITDSVDVLGVCIAQAGEPGEEKMKGGLVIVDEDGGVKNEAFECRAMWALRMAQMNGPRSNQMALDSWSEVMIELADEGVRIGQEAGFVRTNGTVNQTVLKDIIVEAYAELGEEPRLTEKGAVKMDKKQLLGSGNDMLKAYQRCAEGKLAVSKFIPAAQRATTYALASKPNFMVETDRTSWAQPCMHQPPRKAGFRECWQARYGMTYVSADWDGAELGGLAQILYIMFGSSAMMESINKGYDLHLVFALDMWNKENPDRILTYKEAEALYEAGNEAWAGAQGLRQLAKIANFGFPGGLVAKTFVGYAEGYGTILTREQAEELRDAWLEMWPEMVDYLDYFKKQAGWNTSFTYESYVTGFIRGNVKYTNGCNHGFQNIVATALKISMWWAVREMFSRGWGDAMEIDYEYPHSPGDRDEPRHMKMLIPGVKHHGEYESPLYGWRMWLSIHDEQLLEGPEEECDVAADRLQWLMERAMELCTPDVKTGAAPTAMRVWSKSAKEVRDDQGRLVPWAPENWVAAA